MHIFLLGSYGPSLINFRGPLIRALLDNGNKVSVGAPQINNDLRISLQSIGVTVYDTYLNRRGIVLLYDIKYLYALIKIFRSSRPDVLLTYTIKPNIWGAFAAVTTGLRSYSMITGLGYAFTNTGNRPLLREKLARFFARWLYRKSTHCNYRVIFQNPDDRQDFMDAGSLADPAKTRLVNGSGVDMAHYARVPLPDAPVVLMIARLLGSKGVRDYAAAALALRARHPAARFLLVGPFDEGLDSIERDEVKQWIAGGLEYLGFTDDVRPIIAQARIYVLPSYREGTPRSVLEAMAMGRPVITCDAPGCRETVEHGVNGLLVPVRDPQALAAAIDRLLQNPAEAEAMGEAGYALVARKYDVTLVNRSIMEIMGLLPDGSSAADAA